MKKSIGFCLIALLLFICLSSTSTGEVQTVYTSGVANLSEPCPQDCVPVMIVKLIWKDLDVSGGGTGRKIVEEATFTGNEGEREIKFTGVRITPSFPRGEISIDVCCEIKKGEIIVAKFKMDEDDKSNPKPMSYDEASAGKLLNLKLRLKPTI